MAGKRPKCIWIRTDRGVVPVAIKSYDQGEGEFQAAQIRHLVVDEECPDGIWYQIQARFLTSKNPRVVVAATPELNVLWLRQEREAAMALPPPAHVHHYRLRTQDNPARNSKAIEALLQRYKGDPDKARLRLEGLPFTAQGLVYPDTLWTPGHWCDPFTLDGDWARYVEVDPGYRVCAALWGAVHLDGRRVIYREYVGRERSLGENAMAIKARCEGEKIAEYWIDPAAMGADVGTGLRTIDLWRAHFADMNVAPDNRVIPGIEQVKDALGERIGGKPKLMFWRTLVELAEERRRYSWGTVKEHGDVGRDKPVKRDDHLMDCLRYFNAGKPVWVEAKAPVPQAGSLARLFWDERHPPPKETL
jgi:hypothetical protein